MATTSDRRTWTCPQLSGTVDGIDLALSGPDNPDERRLLIEAEHPMLHQALHDDLDEVVLDVQLMNPRLHIALHGIMAERRWADDPPEVWSTAQRLSALGYDRHEVLHMLMSVLRDELQRVMQGSASGPQDPDQTAVVASTSRQLGGPARGDANEPGTAPRAATPSPSTPPLRPSRWRHRAVCSCIDRR